MSSVKPVVKARRQVRQLRTLPTPAAHTRTSGTALEPTRHEHPGWQREEMCCTPTRRHHHSEADIHLQTGRL